jgi:hypothetical protein
MMRSMMSHTSDVQWLQFSIAFVVAAAAESEMIDHVCTVHMITDLKGYKSTRIEHGAQQHWQCRS